MVKKNEMMLLSYLRKNARETLTKISRETRMPVSTIFDKLKKYDNNLIKKATILLDFPKLGYNTRVTMMLKVAKEHRNDLKEHLMKENRVNSFYRVNNNFDFILEGIFINMQEFQEFVEKLEDKFKIEEKEMYYVLDDIKKEEFMANPRALALAMA